MTAPSTSGTYDWKLSTSDCVLESFDRIGLRPPAITANHLVSARRSLNLALQTWANRGISLWLVDKITVPLVAGQSVYSVDPKVIEVLDLYYSIPNGDGSTIDRLLEPISRTDYASYSMKSLEGTPTTYWFDRLNAPTITLWQPPTQGSPYSITYYYVSRPQDANLGGGEFPNINYRFYEAFSADLAARFAEKYAPALLPEKRMAAKVAWDEAAAEDREVVALHLIPRLQGYWS